MFKLELSIQDFLLLGPVRLLPLGDRAFSFYHFRGVTKMMFFFSIVLYSGVLQHGIFRFAFRFRFLFVVGSFFVLWL